MDLDGKSSYPGPRGRAVRSKRGWIPDCKARAPELRAFPGSPGVRDDKNSVRTLRESPPLDCGGRLVMLDKGRGGT
jgi:hypothetical protein